MKQTLDYDALRNGIETDGFVIIRGMYDAAEMTELQAQVDRFIRDIVPTLPQEEAVFDDYSRPETLRKIEGLNKRDPWFNDFLTQGKHVPLLEHFMRDKFTPHVVEYFDKLPFDTQVTPAHQDGFYWCRKPNIGCSLWIALDPVDHENGCLWYARGSHKKILPHTPSGVHGFSQGVKDFDPKTMETAAPAELSPGDAVAHFPGTIHWTEVNRTPRHRRAISTFTFGASTVRDEEAYARYRASWRAQMAERGIATVPEDPKAPVPGKAGPQSKVASRPPPGSPDSAFPPLIIRQ